MLSLNLHIINPWYKENFANLFSRSWLISKNKAFEFEITRYSYDLVTIHFSTHWSGRDHAGPKLELALLGYAVTATVYDTRHWDYESQCWENYSSAVEKT